MRVFLTGGTGAIGKYAVSALVDAGHQVSALARSEAKAAWLNEQGATPVRVSLFDRDELSRAFADHDAVVNLATAMPATSQFALRRAWQPTEHVRSAGSAAVVDAALAAGVGRLVQESVVMIYHEQADRWIDEEAPVDEYPAARGNHASEASAHRFASRGGDAVILRFGLFLGAGAAHSEQMLAWARRHIGLIIGAPASYTSSIHLVDAAHAVVCALTAPPGVYNVVDDEPLTTDDYAAALADAAQAKMVLRLPGRLAVLAGDRLTSLTRSLRVSNARLRAETGWMPRYRSARQGWAATAIALHDAPGSHADSERSGER